MTIRAYKRQEDILHNLPNGFIGEWSKRHQYLVTGQIGWYSDIPRRKTIGIDLSTIDATFQDGPHEFADHALARRGLRALLGSAADVEV